MLGPIPNKKIAETATPTARAMGEALIEGIELQGREYVTNRHIAWIKVNIPDPRCPNLASPQLCRVVCHGEDIVAGPFVATLNDETAAVAICAIRIDELNDDLDSAQ